MGSPDFAVPCLEALLGSPHQVAAVVTQPDRPRGRGQKLHFTPVKERALAAGLPVYQPEKVNSEDFYDVLAGLRPDLFVVVAFGQLLKKKLLALPAMGCVNVHASLLPRYRGAAPIHWSIIKGETLSGVTTMFMDVGMDTGDMILHREIPISAEDTVGSLHDKLAAAGAELLLETVNLIAAGQAPRKSQEHQEATYAPLLQRKDEEISWQRDADQIHNLVRGMNPWPGAYTTLQGQILKVWQTSLAQADAAGRPGRIVEIHPRKGIRVACGRGSLWLTEVQLQGSKRMSGADYARGHRLAADMVLGSEGQ